MRARLARAVLALYPRRVRERYGDEIAGLLANSPRPWRDLADVARAALGERLSGGRAALAQARARTVLWHLVRLMLMPAALTVVLVALMAATGPVLFLADRWVDAERGASVAYALMVLPAALLAWPAGLLLGRSTRLAAPWLAVPVTLALGLLAIAAVPGVGMVLGESLPGAAAAIAVWCAGAAALARWSATLSRVRAAAARVFGTVLLLEAATIAYVLTALAPVRAPRHLAAWWFPSAISGVDPGLVDGAYLQLSDAIKFLPAMLAVCTVFALTVTAVTRTRPQQAPLSA
ncbi:hypothetical protein ACFQY4_23560 [Catellatospora bangladeshensis]|uniref:Uncharacterized protein n=1 Tax=Catellatospora bangladeshensis TaxID=310355 RepID=A0A8J3JKD9_9ACTN|nr:hypothetical protein [Catellatospora bangladeshensis]GIF80238.1 hypothetical protein Cba03nite_15870 [Catellatospora bangladeshensis]